MSEAAAQTLHLRMLEAMLFASERPLARSDMAERLPASANLDALLAKLSEFYEGRGVALKKVADGWAFRTADDLAFLLQAETAEQRRLSRAALETLSIVAYHQPATRAEIEQIRGVSTSRGTLDVLLETGWVRLRGRRRTPGRPVTYGTTPEFLEHFNLESITDLPGLDELKGAGLLDSAMPPGTPMPMPNDDPDLSHDEDPLEDDLFAPDVVLEDDE
uniref:SMC-Scp complex subunit ScpB n=1 Tax=Pararhizobium sp. IMCC3301 TaxID=3067904 RepID=UPI0027417F4A|nr:SMC-Scp complex subunit ScpB [Pararhizobium sp. IMCC3301]